MSTPDTITIPDISIEQARAILVEALKRKAYETQDGNLPADEDVILNDARNLTGQALRAFANGNDNEFVTQILFIAQVDQKPLAEAQQLPAQAAASPSPPTDGNGAMDVTQLADDVLDQLIAQLEGFVATPAVTAELQTFRNEKQRRQEAAGAAQQAVEEVAPPAPPPAAEQSVVPTPPQADAGPVAGTEAAQPQPQAEGSPAPQPPAEDGERAALIGRLTFPIFKAWGMDIRDVDDVPTDQLRFMVEHPSGPQAVNAPTAPVVAPTPDAPTSSGITAERESLEAQVTGQMLKNYGRGRASIPEIGDNELRLMIEHPDAQITQEQLDQARAADQGITVQQAAPPVQVAAPQLAPSASATAAPQLLVSPTAPVVAPTQAAPIVQPEISDGTRRALEIIASENLPIPPEIDETPILPNDVSKCSRDELYSLHARFHACEARAAWIVSQLEDEVGDIVKLLKAREIDVEEEVPDKVGTVKVTEAKRASLIAADPDVKQLKKALHEVEKPLRRMKVLLGSYHRDCDRLSRQMTRFINEQEDTPR